MATTFAFKAVGPTSVVSVTASSTTAITVSPSTVEGSGFAAFLNTGTTVVAVNITNASITAPAAVLPAAGTPSNVIVLPASMNHPVIVSVPAGGFSMTAIGSAAGPSLVYVTPVASL